jgi:hypothetical protein
MNDEESKDELVVFWRRRELNSDPEANAEKLYMLSSFSLSRLHRVLARAAHHENFRFAPSQ